jgi:hypothetical protein
MRHTVVAAALLVLILGCGGSPTSPSSGVQGVPIESPVLAACLNVTEAAVDLYAGCWHGRFARPQLVNGAFSIDGTFRFEAGPVKDESINARFTGSVTGDTLTLNVQPTDPSSQPVTYVMGLGEGRCLQLCV